MTNPKQIHFFDAVRERRFGASTCFLCGCRLGKKNRSDEHVIPKWIQRRFGITNQELHLLNKTTIPYRQLTIPCCYTCNNALLQPIENRMASAVERGATAVRSMDRWDIFIWLGKIFYGLLYRELFLPLDRSGKSKGSITSKPLLKRFAMHHMFLQCVRVPLRFEDFFPASILIVSTQEPGDPKLAFDFRDDLGTMCITCRIGKVGLIGVLQDGGAQQQMFSLLRLERRKLHPIQFTEVVAQVIYKATLMNRVPKYLTIGSDPIAVIQMPLQGFSTRPIFDDWDQYHYAQCLSQITGVPMAELFRPPGQVMTWLRNPDGSSKRLSVKRSRSIHRMAKAPKGL